MNDTVNMKTKFQNRKVFFEYFLSQPFRKIRADGFIEYERTERDCPCIVEE